MITRRYTFVFVITAFFAIIISSCKVYNGEYEALLKYGHVVCNDRPWGQVCNNYIPFSDRSYSYKYELPSNQMTRLDAQIFYWQLAESKYPERHEHKVLLRNSLRVRNMPSDLQYIQHLTEDIKRMKISESL